MNDLKNRAQEAFSYLSDDKLRFWEKIKNSLTSLAGVELTNLSENDRKWFEGELIRINALFLKYDIEKYQDYENITKTDRKKLLYILFTMCTRIIVEV